MACASGGCQLTAGPGLAPRPLAWFLHTSGVVQSVGLFGFNSQKLEAIGASADPS